MCHLVCEFRWALALSEVPTLKDGGIDVWIPSFVLDCEIRKQLGSKDVPLVKRNQRRICRIQECGDWDPCSRGRIPGIWDTEISFDCCPQEICEFVEEIVVYRRRSGADVLEARRQHYLLREDGEGFEGTRIPILTEGLEELGVAGHVASSIKDIAQRHDVLQANCAYAWADTVDAIDVGWPPYGSPGIRANPNIYPIVCANRRTGSCRRTRRIAVSITTRIEGGVIIHPIRRDSISVRELYSLCRPNDLRPKIEESRNGGSSRILYAVGRVESAISTGSREALEEVNVFDNGANSCKRFCRCVCGQRIYSGWDANGGRGIGVPGCGYDSERAVGVDCRPFVKALFGHDQEGRLNFRQTKKAYLCHVKHELEGPEDRWRSVWSFGEDVRTGRQLVLNHDSIPVGGLTPLNRIVSTSFCAKNVFVDEESDAVPGPTNIPWRNESLNTSSIDSHEEMADDMSSSEMEDLLVEIAANGKISLLRGATGSVATGSLGI